MKYVFKVVMTEGNNIFYSLPISYPNLLSTKSTAPKSEHILLQLLFAEEAEG